MNGLYFSVTFYLAKKDFQAVFAIKDILQRWTDLDVCRC